ncbi:MAG: helix-turn-helix domain-containing protein [Prevotellaceae bacterium]|nr:helix-turn-helix domain-containing protein [Prevotellaceae bacterium]
MAPDTNNQTFQLASEFVNQTFQHIFLTGKAGTGKTTFLKHIRDTTHKYCIVAAPTGVAAINAGGVTLHSLFQLPFEPFIPGMEYRSAKDRFRLSGQKLDMLRRLELLIIDEVSMLRADSLDSIDAVLRRIRRTDKPFGGVQMLYIGDMHQLPPVVKDNEWNILKDYYSSPFFFYSKAFQRAFPIYLELKKVYRQREQSFVELLNRVRNNELTQRDIYMLNEQYQPGFKAPTGERYITLTTHNVKADSINNRELGRLTAPVCSFKGEISGEFPEYALPTEMTLTLKKGAQIMFIKNDTGENRRYYNGKIGIIENIDEDRIKVRPDGSGDVITLEREIWKNIRYQLNKDSGEIEEEELGTFRQYPVRLAWAITIHKSQGLTFERAIIDTGDAFAPGQSYVALSRCTSLEGIVLLSPITQKSVWTDRHALLLTELEKGDSELGHLLDMEKRRFWAERLLHYFDCFELIDISRNFYKQLEGKISDDFNPARALAKTLQQQAYEIQTVAEKFQGQLKGIIYRQEQTNDLTQLTERCRKAVEYFHQTIIEKMLAPLQQYIDAFRIKKAKAFYKNICNLELDLKLFIEDMKKVRYNNIPLTGDMDLPVPNRKSLYGKETFTVEEHPERKKKHAANREKATEKPASVPRILSKEQSFELFSRGFSVSEIAATRGVNETTVLAHLAEYVQDGKLPVAKLLSRQTVEELMPRVKEAMDEDAIRLSAIKETVGDKYSYSDIRLVISHCLYERSREKGE